jgi:hypothetical protein
MSTLKTNNVQVGQSVTATNNFTLYQPSSPDGTVRLGNGNSGSVTDVASFTSAGVFAFNSGYGSAAVAYGCRAWVNFNGTGTVAIRASGNVSSITDNGAGQYAINMTTAMPDTNYCVTLAKQNPAGTNMTDIGVHNIVSGSVNTVAPTTSSFSVMLNQSAIDSAYVMCAVFR